MKELGAIKQPSPGRIVAGYFLGITIATCCVFLASIYRVISGRFDDGLLFPIHETLSVILTDFLTFPILWMVAAIASVVPCGVAFFAFFRCKISNAIVHVIVGSLIGAAAAYFLVKIMHNVSWYTDPPRRHSSAISQEFQSIGELFVVAGGFAGLTFWIVAGRFLGGNGSD
jgi:hypothetical protein